MTLVGQDWGGLIGLRLVAEHPDRFARVVAANTGLPTGDFDMPEIWWLFHDAVGKAEVLDIGRLVASGCVRGMSDEVRAAYDAPFPTEESKAGARAMPTLVPDPPRRPGRRRHPARVGGAARPSGRGRSSRLQRLRPDHRRRWTRSSSEHVPGAAGRDHPTITTPATSSRRTPARSSAR